MNENGYTTGQTTTELAPPLAEAVHGDRLTAENEFLRSKVKVADGTAETLRQLEAWGNASYVTERKRRKEVEATVAGLDSDIRALRRQVADLQEQLHESECRRRALEIERAGQAGQVTELDLSTDQE